MRFFNFTILLLFGFSSLLAQKTRVYKGVINQSHDIEMVLNFTKVAGVDNYDVKGYYYYYFSRKHFRLKGSYNQGKFELNRYARNGKTIKETFRAEAKRPGRLDGFWIKEKKEDYKVPFHIKKLATYGEFPCIHWAWNIASGDIRLPFPDCAYSPKDAQKKNILHLRGTKAKILNKLTKDSSYLSPIKVDGQLFTGKIMVYYSFGQQLVFELNLKNGKRVGQFKAYDERGRLIVDKDCDKPVVVENTEIVKKVEDSKEPVKPFANLLEKRKKFREIRQGSAGIKERLAMLRELSNKEIDAEWIAEAMQLLRETRQEFGEQHPLTTGLVVWLAKKKLEKAGIYEEAQALHQKATETKLLLKDTAGIELANYYQELAELGHSAKNFRESLQNADKSARLFKRLGENGKLAGALTLQGILQHRMGNLDEALRRSEEALSIYKKQGPKALIEQSKLLDLQGKIFLEKEQPLAALQRLQKAVENRKQGRVNKGGGIAQSYAGLAQCYAKIENPQKALEMVREGLLANRDNPTTNDYYNKEAALDLLGAKSEALKQLHKKSGKLSDLKAAFEASQEQSQLVNQNRISFQLGEHKARLNDKKHLRVFAKSIQLAKELDKKTGDKEYLLQAFGLAEARKAVLLDKAIHSDEQLALGGIPDSLREKEQRLKREIAELEAQLELAREANDEGEIARLSSLLFEKRREKERFMRALERDYPKYHQLRYGSYLATIQDIQSNLLDQQTQLLEYFFADSFAYIFQIKHDDIHIHEIPIGADFKKDISALRRGLSDFLFIHSQPEKAFELFSQHSHQLYQQFLAPVYPDKLPKRLIVIPDDLLGHIPFEALLVAPATGNDYVKLDYLLRHSIVSYSYSGTLLLENTNKNTSTNKNEILAFAAAYDPDRPAVSLRSEEQNQIRSRLQALPAARREIEQLEKRYKGFFAYDQLANEAVFKQKSSDYNIIHLAMHGLLNRNQPMLSSLAFTENTDSIQDNFLHAHELSRLNLTASLVVLSACETGYGKFEQSEGVMSLARSFMYTGTPSLVVSLWQVNDGATSELMELFYEGLQAGQNKDEALRNAKLAYLDNANSTAAHPSMWAPFVQLGNTKKLQIATVQNYWIWAIAAILIVLIGGLLYFVRKRK